MALQNKFSTRHSSANCQKRNRVFPNRQDAALVDQMNNLIPYKRLRKMKPVYPENPTKTISKNLADRNNSSQVRAVLVNMDGPDGATVVCRLKASQRKESHKRRNDSSLIWTVLKEFDPTVGLTEEMKQKRRKITWLHEPSADSTLPKFTYNLGPSIISSLCSLPKPQEASKAELALPSWRPIERKYFSTANFKGDVRCSRMTKESPSYETMERVKEQAVYNPILHSLSYVPLYRIPGERLWQKKRTVQSPAQVQS